MATVCVKGLTKLNSGARSLLAIHCCLCQLSHLTALMLTLTGILTLILAKLTNVSMSSAIMLNLLAQSRTGLCVETDSVKQFCHLRPLPTDMGDSTSTERIHCPNTSRFGGTSCLKTTPTDRQTDRVISITAQSRTDSASSRETDS